MSQNALFFNLDNKLKINKPIVEFMINIYSIKEIVDATNKILNRPLNKKKSDQNKKTYSKNDIQIKKNIPYILTETVEIEENQIEHINKVENLKPLKVKEHIDKTYNSIDEIYNRLNKKIKKNSLKLIFDQQTEIINLNKKINNLTVINKNILNQQIELNIKIDKLSTQKEKLLVEKDLLNKQLDDINTSKKASSIEIESLKKEKVELEKKISEYKITDINNKKKIYDISEIENKNKFFQEENIRISSELVNIKKKHDILKKEVDKYENQKSNLISKINSVNEALSDTNILTNVFENKVQNKVNIIDHNKIEKEISKDLDDKIKNIFSNKD